MATTRVEDRVLSAFGLPPIQTIRFEASRSIPCGGVMLLLPFLIESGLLSYRKHFGERKGYYTYESLLVTLSFLALLRIKSIEQSKLYNPGELGKLIGYDRIPEVKKLRGMIGELTCGKNCSNWGKDLSSMWIQEESPELYYIDGHVQVYHGYLAELGKKHVSRQRLCLPGMMEFWVNSVQGLPFFFITAPINEKMIEMLEKEIIPELLRLHVVSDEQQEKMATNPDYPLFTLVFDREAYSPALFTRLWKNHRIAILTYRKNVKDNWDEALFEEETVETRLGETTMKLHEEETVLDGHPLREVRRLTSSGHQTSIITTNRIWSLVLIATYMFGRWVQENFFRYMRQEYSIDKIIQYAVDELDESFMVVNREYSNIQYKIKKMREKRSRAKAKMYDHQDAVSDEKKQTAKWINKQLELTEQIHLLDTEIEGLVEERKKVPYKIPVGQMPESVRYVKLHQESKHFQNIIKMICYRAETALANKLAPHYSRADHEVRALIKAVTHLSIDLMPDEINKQLNITLYPLANGRSLKAVSLIMKDVNDTKTVYPGTDLVMNFKFAT